MIEMKDNERDTLIYVLFQIENGTRYMMPFTIHMIILMLQGIDGKISDLEKKGISMERLMYENLEKKDHPQY